MYNKLLILLICFFPWVSANAGIISSHTETDDAVMHVSSISGAEIGTIRPVILAGYNSGKIICFDTQLTSPPLQLWNKALEGPVKYVLHADDLNSDGMDDVVISTGLGNIAAYNVGGLNAGNRIWLYETPSGIDALCESQDINSDGVKDIIAGGGGQILYCLSGISGTPIWQKNLYSVSTNAYVHVIEPAGDINHDGTNDIAMKTWDGIVWIINPINGSTIWSKSVDGGFTEAFTNAGDISGDGENDFFTGSTSKVVRMISGVDGSAIWQTNLGRPIRSVAAVPDINGDGYTDCVGVTAGGMVSMISGKSAGSISPIWSAQTGDCVRDIVCPGDLNSDSKADIIVCSENGIINAFSGLDGTQIYSWETPDIVRDIALVPDINSDGLPEIASASLDGALCLISPASGKIISPKTNPDKLKNKSRSTSNRKPQSNQKMALSDAVEVPILLYHDIIPQINYYYGASVNSFTEQMDVLQSAGYTAVTLDEVADWIEGKITLPEKSVCITFDGPYEGHYTHAAKIMKDRGLSANSYVTTDWIGTANHCEWNQLREMDVSGVENIQNHTANHPSLASVPADEVRNQLRWCNQSIRDHLYGKDSLHHAYPGGSYNASVMQILAEEGFRTATTVSSRRATKSDNLLALPRLSIVKNTTLSAFNNYIGNVEPTPSPTPSPDSLPYNFVGTVGGGWGSPSFADIDSEGKLWVCDYNADRVRVFNSNGTEAAFSPLTQGLNQSGAVVPCDAPSGIAVTPSGNVLVSICDYFDTPQYLGLFIYRASDGAALNGLDLTYKCGDVDCDDSGNIFVVDKTIFKWHVYKPDGTEYSGSPIGPQTESHIQRGISVRPDGSKVYVISETDAAVHVWSGSVSPTGISYTEEANLVTGLGSASGGVDVMDDGKILVGYDPGSEIIGFHPDHSVWGKLSGGSPALVNPRGTAFTPDGKYIFVTCKSGTPMVQKWERSETTRVTDWLFY